MAKVGKARDGNRSFYPPLLNTPFVRLLQSIFPWLAHTVYKLDLIVTSEPLVQLNVLQGKPCLLVCNHSTFDDRIVMFLLSAQLGEPFYYMAAYEQFLGWNAKFYQWIGAYSVQRGMADRDSIAQTLQLLSQPDCKLVIFPEGGCSFQNDTVMPFRPGAIQIGLQAMARSVKQGNPIPDLYVVPISLKYRYTGKMTPVIEAALQRLEQALAVSGTGDYYQRLRTIAAAVLQRFEQDYGMTPPDPEDWNQRIAALKATVLQQCEQRLELASNPKDPDRERVYRVRHALEQQQSLVLAGVSDPWAMTAKAMMRVLNFDAIYDGYVGEKPTPERFLDTLTRLE
ncbi:MAG TPA: lysophospholipid acyltransferase family protein, partial [Allocoleopsis sp.]